MIDLKAFFLQVGEFLITGIGSAFLVEDSATVFYIERGNVDLFIRDKKTQRLYFFKHIEENKLFFCNKFTSHYEFVAKTGSNTRLVKTLTTFLAQMPEHLIASAETLIEQWVIDLTKLVWLGYFPRMFIDVNTEAPREYTENENLAIIKTPLWITITKGIGMVFGDAGFELNENSGYFPLTNALWVTAKTPLTLNTQTTGQVMKDPKFSAYMKKFLDVIFGFFEIKVDNEKLLDSIQVFEKIEHGFDVFEKTTIQLSQSFSDKLPEYIEMRKQVDDLQIVVETVCDKLNIRYDAPSLKEGYLTPVDRLKKVLRLAKLLYRKVKLVGKWYETDHGPMIGFNQSMQPIAIYQNEKRKYVIFNPKNRSTILVDQQSIRDIMKEAYLIYPPMPETKMSIYELVLCSLKGLTHRLAIIFWIALLVSGLALVAPVFTQLLFDYVIPYTKYSLLLQISLILLTFTVCLILGEAAKRYALYGLEAKIDCYIQSALWGRLLRLPLKFFKRYTTGDLTNRMVEINRVRHVISGGILFTLISGLFSLVSILYLFFLSPKITLLILIYLTIFFLITYHIAKTNLFYENKAAIMNRQIYSLLGEIVSGITTIRTCGAELNIFSYWAKLFISLWQVNYRAKWYGLLLTGLIQLFPLFGTLLLFAGMAYFYGSNTLSLGSFLAFNATLGQLLAGLTLLYKEAMTALFTIPIVEQIKPVLEETPEVKKGSFIPTSIDGKIELSHVSFAYPNGPFILNDISLEINPTEYIAIVGASGSGKSTLLRLMLGFEKPSSGQVLYDSRDATNIDLDYFRNYISVVLQNDEPIPDSIYSNIAGGISLSEQDAWEAVAKVDFADDIRAMPMGMNTVVGMGGSGLSGGQKQKLMLARALASHPKILFLDEATSSLDNLSQRHVMDALARMKITRVVIAHRLSTVVGADRILVLHEGKIVEQGSFEELIMLQGKFYSLSQAQLG